MRKSVFYGALVVLRSDGSLELGGPRRRQLERYLEARPREVEITPPAAATKSQTLKFEATPAGTKLTADGVDAEGKPMSGGWTSKMDGKEVPLPEQLERRHGVTQEGRRQHLYEQVEEGRQGDHDSKVVVSADGKTLTVTQTGKNAKGEAVNMTAVYVKQ